MTREPAHRARRPVAACLLAITLAALVLGVTAARPAPAAAVTRAPLALYRGLGAWVDMYDGYAWSHPAQAVDNLAAHHVRTLFIETSNYHWPTAVNKPSVQNVIIEACHAHGIKVVAWYLPGFSDPAKDYARSMAAINYRTPGGQKFDSFALDIEANIVKIKTRIARLHALNVKLRKAVGSAYPMGGIIPSPIGMTHATGYWPGFPYKDVAAYYDVILPMGYYTYHGNGYANAFSDTRANITIIRQKTGRPDIPIHVIGGLAGKSSETETQAFVRATRLYGIIGASLYDATTSDAGDWRQLANVRTNPVQHVVLPRTTGYTGVLGNCPGDRTHPKEAFFTSGAQNGQRILRYRLYDAQAGEIRLLVNWKDMGALPAGPGGDWSAVREAPIPASALNAKGTNVIGFVAAGVFPDWHIWGVEAVTLTAN